MNNEEKKAIDRLKKDTEKPLSCGDITIVIIDDINAVLNLIEKQQKEIEDKKEEAIAIARANYILGQTDERSQWYKKINEKIEDLEKERKEYELEWEICDDIEAEIAFLKELIGKEE